MGARPGWIGYIGVPDVDAYATKITAAGGRIYRAAADIPGVGRFAVVGDPHGAAFVVFKGEPAEDPRPPLAPDAPGNVGWRELRAGELESAFAFYSGLFGWKKTQAMDMGPMGTYQLFDDRRRTGRRHDDQDGRDAGAVLALLFQRRRDRRGRRRDRAAWRRRSSPARTRCPAAAGSCAASTRKARTSRCSRPDAERAHSREARKGLWDRVDFVLCCARVSRRGRCTKANGRRRRSASSARKAASARARWRGCSRSARPIAATRPCSPTSISSSSPASSGTRCASAAKSSRKSTHARSRA